MALKANSQISEEEAKKMKDGSLIVRVIEGQKRILDNILTKKKLKQSYEYEVLSHLKTSGYLVTTLSSVVSRSFQIVYTFIIYGLSY
jgi:elongation factor 3